MPLAIIVKAAGRKMQKDFEPILERQIHRFINYAQGIMHIGQRDINWLRISKEAFEKGFRLKHIGVILHAMLHSEFSAIVDKVQVDLYTVKDDVEKLKAEALKVYDERDERLSGMTDESVDTYYSCSLCQSFAQTTSVLSRLNALGCAGRIPGSTVRRHLKSTRQGRTSRFQKAKPLTRGLGNGRKSMSSCITPRIKP